MRVLVDGTCKICGRMFHDREDAIYLSKVVVTNTYYNGGNRYYRFDNGKFDVTQCNPEPQYCVHVECLKIGE